jgi:hypothetical protein
MGISLDIPLLQCSRKRLGPVEANPFADPWLALTPVFLSETVTGTAPKQNTWVKTAWNDEGWRVLFYAEDTHVWATHTERDAPLYEEEVVEIFVDPSGFPGDPDSYFEIEVNPLNAVMDLVLRRNRSGFKKDFAWNCEGLETAITLLGNSTPDDAAKRETAGCLQPGWCAEFSIPFRSLNTGARQPEWRVNFYRIDRPQNAPRELSAWSPTGVGTFHQPGRFGVLQFVD